MDVVKLVDMTEGEHIEREMMLIKVHVEGGAEREEIKRLVDIFRGRIIDVSESMYTIELTGTGAKLDALIQAVGSVPILEVVRSGSIGIARGTRSLHI